MPSPLTIVNQYAASVRDGSLPSCKMVKLAVERWYKDWERTDIYFDRKALTVFVNFAATLKHFKGEWAGRPIILEPWELFVVANIFCWKYKSTKKRRYTYADVYVPRKNGKTTFAAVIALFMLVMDGESAAEVYAAAVDKEQAKICFDASAQLVQNSGWGEYVKYFRKGSIVVEETASAYKPLSKETRNKDGLNIHCAICDERHAWKTTEIMDVIVTGIGARSQPLIFSISTAGVDTSYPYFADLEDLRNILRGIRKKENHFCFLFEPDKDDQWDDEATWMKCNPNYGVSLSKKYMREECENAKARGGTTLAAFQTKNLNMWVDAPDIWIQDDDVVANNAPFDESKLAGEDAYVGIDLASKTDITAVAFFFPKFNVVKFLFTIPEKKFQDKTSIGDIVDYRLWKEQGWLTICPGPVLDEDWWMKLLFAEMDKYKVRCITYDPWGMWQLKTRFGKYEDKLMEYPQDIRHMSVPTKEMEGKVLRHELNFLDNPMIRWMMKNVVIYVDPNGNIKLDKARSRNKIDGVVALVDAIGGWLNITKGKTGEIYVSHGLRVISANSDND